MKYVTEDYRRASWICGKSPQFREGFPGKVGDPRLVKLLGLGTSIYNIETRECLDGKAYIMECSPRGGGNRLAEMLRYATGVDMIKAAVSASVGELVTEVEQKPYDGFWAEVILHSDYVGIFDHLWIDERIRKNIVEVDLWAKKDNRVAEFRGANDAIGTIVLRFDDDIRMNQIIGNINDYVRVILQ